MEKQSDALDNSNSKLVMKCVKFTHLDRMWPKEFYKRNVRKKNGKYPAIMDIEVKWHFLMILRTILDQCPYMKITIQKSIISMMYAKHVLRVVMDWSSLPCDGFGHLSTMYLVRKSTMILNIPLLDWFREDPSLYEKSGAALLANQTKVPEKKRR